MKTLFILLYACSLHAQSRVTAERPGRKWTTIERAEPAHLAAVHAMRMRFAEDRKDLSRKGPYTEYRAVIHIHAEDSSHTLGTRSEVLEAARELGIQVVLFTDHGGPKQETWSGMRDGVLFLAGGEIDHELRSPGEPALRFLSHLEEIMKVKSAGYNGSEIYNRHADDKDEQEFHVYLGGIAADPLKWAIFVDSFKTYPDEMFAVEADYPADYLAKYDQETQIRPLTAVGANDSHQNTQIHGVTLDPYAVSFHNLQTHILARELSDSEIRKSLAGGRTFVAHDWLCDTRGFSFSAASGKDIYEIGDTLALTTTVRMSVASPVPAHLKLIRNGRVIQQTDGAELKANVTEPGVYRVEAWLAVDNEQRPWIYTSPIYVTPTKPR